MNQTERCIARCGHCGRHEFMFSAGQFFWRCAECFGLVAK